MDDANVRANRTRDVETDEQTTFGSSSNKSDASAMKRSVTKILRKAFAIAAPLVFSVSSVSSTAYIYRIRYAPGKCYDSIRYLVYQRTSIRGTLYRANKLAAATTVRKRGGGRNGNAENGGRAALSRPAELKRQDDLPLHRFPADDERNVRLTTTKRT